MKEFVKKYFTLIVLIIALASFLNTCSVNRGINSIDTNINAIKDSTYTKGDLDLRLKIEGLKAEKRMIQATDRKMLDVNRENAIDEEIRVLNEKLK